MSRFLCGVCVLGLLSLFPVAVRSQDSLSRPFSVQAYGEFYYSYDFSRPAGGEKPFFVYNHKRHHELGINLLMMRLSYETDRFRSHLGLMAGHYAVYNLAAEPTWARMLYEANAGVRLSPSNDVWLDAGVLPSHIGFESAIGADCWTLTRSMAADNSPYYESGLRLSGNTKSKKLYLSVLLLNGWQRINIPAGPVRLSGGAQATYRTGKSWLFNYSLFVGKVQPGPSASVRTYHNVYAQYDAGKALGITAGLDVGTDADSNQQTGIWYTPVLMFQYRISKRFSSTLRGEYFHDSRQLILPTGAPEGFQVAGISGNLDIRLHEAIRFRLEGKYLQSAKLPIWSTSRQNHSVTAALTVRY